MSKDFYENNLLLKDALQIYFSKYHFKDGGYHDKYFRMKIGKLLVPFPNFKSRLDAVKRHDVHHVITGYRADWRGEIEIAGWELASGCGNYFMAWFFNLGSLLLGIVLYPQSLYLAFMEGRMCKHNLYGSVVYNDDLMNKSLGEIRADMFNEKRNTGAVANHLWLLWYFIAALLPYALAVFLICKMAKL